MMKRNQTIVKTTRRAKSYEKWSERQKKAVAEATAYAAKAQKAS
jgi:hypothetical protein